jgi:hypothetical protein
VSNKKVFTLKIEVNTPSTVSRKGNSSNTAPVDPSVSIRFTAVHDISLLIHYQKFGRQFIMKPSRIWGCLLPGHTSPPPQLRQPHPCRPLFGLLLALGCHSFPYLHAVLISATSVALVFFTTATTRHNLAWACWLGWNTV